MLWKLPLPRIAVIAVLALLLAPRMTGAGIIGGPDMTPTAIEVTQSVQDLPNNVTLIAGKNTYVRVHANAMGTSFSGVFATLTGFRIVVPGPPTPLGTINALNDPLTVELAPFRSNEGDSFLFQLPFSWRNGTVQLVASIRTT